MSRLIKCFFIFIFIISVGSSEAYAQDAELERVQIFLTEQGYDPGDVDGFMGPKTRAAIARFQLENGLNVTGKVDSNTLATFQKTTQVESKPIIDDKVGLEQAPDNSTSAFLWLLMGAFLMFLFSRLFGKKTPVPEPKNNTNGTKKVSQTLKERTLKNKENSSNRTHNYVAKRNDEVLSKLKAEKANQRQLVKKPVLRDSESDDLTSFRIEFSSPSSSRSTHTDDSYGLSRFSSMGRRPTVAEIKSESKTCWVPKGKTVKVAGVELSHGMIYVGSKLRSQKYGGIDNCLINPKLKVAAHSGIYDVDTIGYWPSYEGLSPKARRKYLMWLEGGAKDPDANIGFVFLYFYGLERRLFLDKSLDEAESILLEMRRLQQIYSDNHSLQRYIENALSFATIFDPVSTLIPILEIPKKPSWELPMNVALYLGNKLKAGELLTNDDALLWFLNHPEKHLRTPAKRLEDEFISLVKAKLDEAQPNGPKVRMPKGKFDPEYSSCSSTFSTKFKKYTKGIPNISNIKAPVNVVQKLADEAMDELDKLSRLLGRNPEAKGTFKALSLLPPQLISEFGGTRLNEVKVWISDRLNNKYGVFTFQEFIKKTTDLDGKKVTKSIHRDVYAFVNSLGWNMVPTPYETIGTLKPESKFLLIRADIKNSPEQKPSDEYLLAFLKISLGAYIAHADDRLLEVEVEVLVQKAKSLTHLTVEERNRLFDVISWLAIQTTDFGAINRKIKSVGNIEKKALAELAIAVAVADGKIEPGEVRALETVYQTLGFDKKDLYSGLHAFGSSNPQFNKKASLIDGKLATSPEEISKGVELDMERVKNTLADTQKASTLLASIFEDEEPEALEVDVTEEEIDAGGNQRFRGLDFVHAQLLTELLGRSKWLRDDFIRLAESLNLLPDGAMEVINEWAFEKFDEPILEDGEPIEVYSDLLDGE